MDLKYLKDWINSLPEEFMEYNVCIAEAGDLDGDGMYQYRLDKPVIALNVDEETKEVLIMSSVNG